MAVRVVSSNKVRELSPVATLKKLPGKTYGYDKPYKLYSDGDRFYIIAQCESYNDGCGLYLAFEKKDLRATSCGGYGGFDYYGHEYKCPRCGARNWIDTGVFPALVNLVSEKQIIRSKRPLMTIEEARKAYTKKVERKSKNQEMLRILEIILKDQGLNSRNFTIEGCRNNKITLALSNKGLLSKVPKQLEDYRIETKVP